MRPGASLACGRLPAGLDAPVRPDTTTRDRLPSDAWPLVWGMRNRIAPDFLPADTDIMRRTLPQDLPPNMASIKADRTDASSRRTRT